MDRVETFTFDDGCLVRSVVPSRGNPYVHRCPSDSYERVAHAIEAFGGEAFTLEQLKASIGDDVRWTEAAVAFAFLKDRDIIVDTNGRKSRVDNPCVFETAMLELKALHVRRASAQSLVTAWIGFRARRSRHDLSEQAALVRSIESRLKDGQWHSVLSCIGDAPENGQPQQDRRRTAVRCLDELCDARLVQSRADETGTLLYRLIREGPKLVV